MVACLALFSCARHNGKPKGDENNTQTEVNTTDSIYLVFQRKPCYGTCPHYDLTIYQNGYAVYEGKRFVDSIGKFETTLNKATMQKIADQLEDSGYFSLADEYPEDGQYPTDLPQIIIRVKSNGLDKTVVDNRYDTPQRLNNLENFIDLLVEDQDWHQIQ